MTPAELKKTLLKQYEDTVTQLRQLEGAIQACDELLKPTEETPTDD
jgi:hypothetical protein